MIKSCDPPDVEVQTPTQGCGAAETEAESPQGCGLHHNTIKRIRLSEEVKKKLLELSVGSCLRAPVSYTFSQYYSY